MNTTVLCKLLLSLKYSQRFFKTSTFVAFSLFLLMTTGSVFGQNGVPSIDKIDPPNWWAPMPDPLLLVHGKNLHGANFTVDGKNVTLLTQKISESGTWAFLTLKTEKAQSQTLKILAKSTQGKAEASYELKPRHNTKSAFQGFSSADVMYLIMTDRFSDGDTTNNSPAENQASTPYDRKASRGWHGGDLKGIENHIDYLKGLGVTTIWITPVYKNVPSSESYHGYGATDMYAVDPHYGSLADLQSLSDALHRNGMKLVLDTVPNHVGPKHPWLFDSPTPDWFHGNLAQHQETKGDFRLVADIHASEESKKPTTDGWFANILPDLNQENPLVSQYLIQNAIWWTESAGLDGLRLDTFPYVGRAFWHDFHRQLHDLYPKLTTVGEIFNPDATITAFFAGGTAKGGIDTGLDTPFDFPMYFALRGTLAKGEPLTKISEVLRQDWLYPHPERLVPFLGNHDTSRFLSEGKATPEKLKLAFGFLATLRGMPQLYSGDEIAMSGGDDPENRHDFPGGFPGDKSNGFTQAGRTPEQQEMAQWVTDLLQLRKKHLPLQSGKLQELHSDDTTMLYARYNNVNCGKSATAEEAPILVAVNNGSTSKTVSIDFHGTVLEGCSIAPQALLGKQNASPTKSGFDILLSPNTFELFSLR